MQESLKELERLTYNNQDAAMKLLQGHIIHVCIMSIIQTAVILFLIILTSHLGIKPVLKAVEKIKDDDPIPEIGANEFRYLAQTYNKMYAIYKGSLERLNFKASHDELTGAYNRSGYDLLLSSVDMSNTHLLLFDLDNFKGINDTFGHEICINPSKVESVHLPSTLHNKQTARRQKTVLRTVFYYLRIQFLSDYF